ECSQRERGGGGGGRVLIFRGKRGGSPPAARSRSKGGGPWAARCWLCKNTDRSARGSSSLPPLKSPSRVFRLAMYWPASCCQTAKSWASLRQRRNSGSETASR